MFYNRVILLKYGEIVLKGLNKSQFEGALLKNIKYRLKPCGNFSVTSCQSTIYVAPEDAEADVDAAFERLGSVFGISRLSVAAAVEKDISKIVGAADFAADALRGASTFKVETKRADKKFPMTSPQISAEMGAAILEMLPGLKVDVADPEVTVYVEIREKAAYVHAGSKKGAGGLPVGTGGKALLLLSGGIDSPVAGYMMAKRGVTVEALYFESPPYTSELALEKVVSLAKIISEYCGSLRLHTVSVRRIQEAIRANCDGDYSTLLLRRFMMRMASAIADKTECGALITGESLGQVASQTMAAISVTEEASEKLVFRPLIGMDKEEIVTVSRAIGAFDTSILPYEDCCTVFTPHHPCTQPKLAAVKAEEEKLDVAALVAEALETEKIIII